MALGEAWKIHSIVLDIDNLGSVAYIGALTQGSLPPDVNVVREQTGTSLFPSNGRIELRSVAFNFTSLDLAKMVSLIGISGACITTTNPKVGVQVYAAKWGCSGIASGSVHRKYVIKQGALYINSISCDHQGDASVSATLRATYDGTNAPVTVTENVALPSAANLADTGRWTLGPAAIEGVTLLSKKSVNIDFNTTVSTEGVDSEPYDRIVLIDSVQPTVSVVGIDPEWFNDLSVPLTGAVMTHASTIMYFSKRNTPSATAEHVSMTAAGLAHWRNLFDASGRGLGQTTLEIATLYDGTNAPLVIDDTSTLP